MRVANEEIKAARERLGLTLRDVAERSGLSWNEYFDVELHENEAREVAHLRNVRKLCDALGLDLLDLFGVDCAYCLGRVEAAGMPPLPRNEAVRLWREKFGLSQDQLGDLIGFETVAIKEMEEDPGYLDGWSIELVEELAGYLEVPVQRLLGVTCRKCGR